MANFINSFKLPVGHPAKVPKLLELGDEGGHKLLYTQNNFHDRTGMYWTGHGPVWQSSPQGSCQLLFLPSRSMGSEGYALVTKS